MINEDIVFKRQAHALRSVAALLQNRVELIDNLGRSLNKNEPIDEQRQIALLIFKSRSLKFYADVLLFLAEKLENNKENFFFLLSNLRTLLDIYARFLHLVNIDKDKDLGALKCIAYQAISYKPFAPDQYQIVLDSYKDFIEQTKFLFPETSNDFDFDWIRTNGLNFPNKKKVLTEENMKNHSTFAVEVFPKHTGSYDTYAAISEFLHGNPYYYYGGSHNERFWTAAMAVMNSALLIELVDQYTLGKRQPRDFRLWLNEVDKAKPEFQALWVGKK